MTAKQVEAVSLAILEGGDDKTVQPLIDELFASGLDDEDLISLYKHLPRRLTSKHLPAVLKAEEELSANDVSQALLLSEFDGVDRSNAAAFVKVVDHVVRNAGSSDALSASVQQWRLFLISSGSKDVDVDAHSTQLITAALATPSLFVFEPIVDAISAVKLSDKTAKQLLTLMNDVMVEATGVAGLKKFESAAGADFLSKLGVADAAARKARLLSMSRFMKGRETVGFDEIQKELELDSDEAVEKAVVDAALGNIIDAAVRKQQREVVVHSVVSLKFDQSAWKALGAQLENWIELTNKATQ